jgi:hypothetical protein
MKLKLSLPLLLAPLLLTACTGTTEPQTSARVALINGGGTQLRTVTPGAAAGDVTQPVSGAVGLEALPGGSQLTLAFRDHLELRDAALAPVGAARLPLPAGFRACFVRLRASPARDRVAALSDCGSGAQQQLVVYRSDGSLAFTADVPPPSPSSSDLSRFAVTTGQAVWLTRPALGGGYELLRADENGIRVVTAQALSINVYDLAMLGSTLYAATDSGTRPVNLNDGTLGEPTGIKAQVNRVYGGDRVLGAWLSGVGSQPLNIWDGVTTGVAAYPSDLRDVTFTPDGNAFALSGTALTQFDVVLGLRQSLWQPTDVAGPLNDARAVTWLTAP